MYFYRYINIISFNSSHQAAVKALAWCPWLPSLLASGGGTADRKIRFWNCNSGVCINDIDTQSQVKPDFIVVAFGYYKKVLLKNY